MVSIGRVGSLLDVLPVISQQVSGGFDFAACLQSLRVRCGPIGPVRVPGRAVDRRVRRRVPPSAPTAPRRSGPSRHTHRFLGGAVGPAPPARAPLTTYRVTTARGGPPPPPPWRQRRPTTRYGRTTEASAGRHRRRELECLEVEPSANDRRGSRSSASRDTRGEGRLVPTISSLWRGRPLPERRETGSGTLPTRTGQFPSLATILESLVPSLSLSYLPESLVPSLSGSCPALGF